MVEERNHEMIDRNLKQEAFIKANGLLRDEKKYK